MKNIWTLWKKKWNVDSDKRMMWLFLMFAITGSSSVVVRKFLFTFFNIDIQNPYWYFVAKFVAIYIVYQFLLFTVGTIMGERQFVQWFLIKMNSALIGKRKN